MANQRFQIQFDFQANMGPIKTSVQDLQKTLSGINLPSNVSANFEKLFGKLDSEMADFQAMTKNGFTNMADVGKAQTAFSRITKIINQISLEAGRVKGIDPNKLLPKEAQKQVEDLKKKLGELQNQQDKKNEFAKQIEKQNNAIKQQKKELQDLETKRKALEEDAKSLGGQKGAATKRRNEAQALLNKAMADRDALIAKGTSSTDPKFQAAKKDIDTYSKAVRDAQNQIDTLTNKLNTNATSMRNNSANTEIAERELSELQSKLMEMQSVQVSPQGLLELRQELARLLNINLDEVPNDLKAIQTTIDGINENKLAQIKQHFIQIDTNLDNIEGSSSGARQGMQGIVNSAQGLDRAAQDAENLKNQVMHFFSMTNSVQLFKRAVTSALNTVKELDKTMTEAAVVTEFDVGDMWEKLPQYSANAQKLGVSINGMYQATTLYYQQGLKTNEAMTIGIETMKMARIAGMESAEATEAMTAALRGFNMELNEASATRVNDVYSQLAAVTAADTNQIATAMSKTASIAASANMEFETTAALLAQIIETTQEAPETAGTALKTIIARFSEVKSLRDQGQTTGKDSEGEDIDVNKIQTALRTVGISMEGFFAGTEGLDSILLKLAGKWEGLDFETQRYIATMAAGSRQQSRFIAMMSDYARTTELVGEAQNSSGASQRQFNKTLDSMDTKLQKLENAWNEFLMGLSNNDVLKGAIDILTSIIEGVNKLTDALSGGKGLVKSLTSLLTVVGALKMGRAVLQSGLNWIGGATGIQNQQKGATGQNMVPNTEADGHEMGQKTAKSWSDGFRNFMSKNKQLRQDVKNSMALGQEDLMSKRSQRQTKKSLVKKYGIHRVGSTNAKNAKRNYMAEIKEMNPQFDEKQIKQVQEAWNESTKGANTTEAAVKAANDKVRELGGSFVTTGENAKQAAAGAGGLAINLQSIGAGGMALGGLVTTIASLASYFGADEDWVEALSKIGGIIMGIGSAIMLVSQIMPVLGLSFSETGLVIATAGWSAQAAWWWLIPIIAIIAGVIIAISSLGSQEEELAKKTEKLNAAYETFSENANQAKENLEQLAETQSELSEMSDSFGNLAQGTREWNQNLIESNQKVLELMDQYEGLSAYISKGAYGELVISNKGWEEITNQQQKKYNQSIMAKNVVSNQLAQVDYEKEVRSELRFNVDDDYYDIERLLNMAADRNLSLATDEKKIRDLSGQLFGDSGETFDYLMESTENLREKFDYLAQETAQLDLEKQMRNESLLNTVMESSEIMKDKKYGTQLGVLFEEGTERYYEENVENFSKNYKYDENLDVDEGVNKDIIEKYAKIQDMEVSEVVKQVKEGSLDYSAMAQALGIHEANEGLIKTLERMTKMLASIEKNDATFAKDFNGLLTEGGTGLTTFQLSNLEGSFDATSFARKAAVANGMELSQFAGYLNMYDHELIAMLQKNYELAQATKKLADTEISNILNKEGGQALQQLDISTSAYSTLAKNLNDVIVASGTEAADSLGQMIVSMANQSGNVQGFIDTINSLDWTNVDSVNSLGETLKALGLSSNLTEKDIKDLEKQILMAADATRKWDLETLAEALKKNSELLKNLNERNETDRSFDQEEYKALTEKYDISPEDFVIGLDGDWIYIGESMADLTTAVQKNTAAILSEAKGNIKEKVAKAQLWEGTGAEDLDIIEKLLNGEYRAGQGRHRGEIGIDWIKNFLISKGASEEEVSGLTSDQLMEKLRTEHSSYGSKGAREVIYSEAARFDSNEKVLGYMSSLSEGASSFDLRVEAASTGTWNEMDAAIKALASTTEGATGQYTLWNSQLSETDKNNKNLNRSLQVLAIKTANAQKANKAFGETLSDNLEDFKKGKKGGQSYILALENISRAAQQVFGENATAEFVDANRELFIQLAQGGEAAEEAFKQIQDKILATRSFVKHSGDQIRDVINSAGGDIEIGATFDPTEAINELLRLGYTAEQVARIMQDMGYEVDFDIQTHWIGALTKTDYGWEEPGETINGEIAVPVKMIHGVASATKVSDSSSFSPSSGGGGGGNEWKNPYDEFYNTVEKINEELRTREQLERRYQRLLNRNTASAKELAEITRDQLASLETELKDREGLLEGRKRQMSDIESEYSDVGQYAWYNEKTGQIEIRWDLLEGLEGSTDEELTSRIEEYISKLEEQQNKIEEEQDAIEEIKDAVWEIYEQGKDQYFDLENLVKEAIITERQQEIDKLSEINESINDTSSKILDSMQEQLDEYRQNRDNQKTEEEIADKQRRLAYLQQDTSGANALEILRLQKEIDEATEDYTDTLIDQKISELQKQNDEAAEQRQQQIDIMQAQLDKYIESGEIWDEVHTLMEEGLDEENGLIRGSRLEELLKNEANWEGLSKLQQMDWLNELNRNIAEALAWLQGGGIQHLFGEGKEITFTDADGNLLTGTIDEMGNVIVRDQNGNIIGIYSASSFGIDSKGRVTSSQTSSQASQNYQNQQSSNENQQEESDWPASLTKPSELKEEVYWGSSKESVTSVQTALKKLKYYNGEITGTYDQETYEAIKKFQRDAKAKGWNPDIGSPDGIVGGRTKKAFRAVQYKTGGIADFTGPAWLDGTKSKPEYILNADQTRAFFTLVDVLSSLQSSGSKASQNSGDNTYDIDINVESIGSDYDVEQLADTIKRLINDDARYRNNNTINLSR